MIYWILIKVARSEDSLTKIVIPGNIYNHEIHKLGTHTYNFKQKAYGSGYEVDISKPNLNIFDISMVWTLGKDFGSPSNFFF